MVASKNELFSSFQVVNLNRFTGVNLNRRTGGSLNRFVVVNFTGFCNYVPSSDDFWNNYGFENVNGEKKTFKIDINSAIEVAKQHGLIVTDSSNISEFLTWENFKKQTFYNGQFRYYITDLTSKTEYKSGQDRQGIIYRYDVYSFNPWTGEFVEKKKMKSRHEWDKASGHSTGLMPDND